MARFFDIWLIKVRYKDASLWYKEQINFKEKLPIV